MNDLNIARNRLKEESLSLCIVRNGEILFENKSTGIRDVFGIVKNNSIEGSSVADKIIGKAVALLFIGAGVKGVFGISINKKALDILKKNDIKVEYDNLVDRLISNNNVCKFEKAVLGIDNPKDAAEILEKII